MPAYRCSACGKHTHVRNTRGARIRDRACGYCGAQGTLQGATTGRPSKNAGRHYERCAACGKRALDHAHPAFAWEPKYYYTLRLGPFAPGSPACWREEPVRAAGTRHATVHQALEARYGDRAHASGWASEDEQRRMGLPVGREEHRQDPRLREPCQICGNTPSRDEDGYYSHHISAYRFEHGVAAVLVCEGCGHTRLLAELPNTGRRTGRSGSCVNGKRSSTTRPRRC
jgi:hypothetical protein